MNRIKKKGRKQFGELGIALFIIIIFVAASIIQPRFISYNNIKSITLYTPLLITVAMGEMMVIVSRNYDLSVGSIMGFAGLAVGFMIVKYPGMPIILAFVIATCIGAVLGAVNGLIITRFKLHSIIVTLGTMNIFRGIIYVFTGGRMVSAYELPKNLLKLTTTKFPIPWVVTIAVVVAVIVAMFLRRAHLGREIFVVGSNPIAARLRGVEVNKVIIFVFLMSGALAGFAGMLYASRFGMLNPNQTGIGFEFEVLAATIIGGVSVNGGSGTVLGVVLGCLLLGVVNVALAVVGISGKWQEVSYGIIIVAALTMDSLNKEKMRKAALKEVNNA